MKKQLITTIVLILTVFVSANSQEEQVKILPEFNHSIGFDAGGSNGYGFSYRYWPGKWGVQINTFPYISVKTYDVSFGVSLLNRLYESEKIRFYLYYGNHLLFERYENFNYNYEPNPPYEYTYTTAYKSDFTWVTGVGPGFEFYMANRLGFNIRFGIGYYFRGSDDWEVQPDGGIGLCFRF